MATPVALRVFEGLARTYRKTWRGSVISSFLNPLLYLAALGFGLGGLVDRGEALGIDRYVSFLAPGLLAATAMQAAAGEASYPVMAGIKWLKTYHAALATPVGSKNLMNGHFLWIALRLTFTCVVFAVFSALFGAVAPVPALASVVPSVFTGMAFATPITAFTSRLENETGLATLFRFGVIPLFLFSGTFYPISQLPGWLLPAAYLSPLWHGVELTRSLSLQTATAWPPILHILCLSAWLVAGLLISYRTFSQRMVK